MKENWQYAKYLFRHKLFVLIAGIKYGVPIWRLLIHDWSKFMLIEWVAYRDFFYGERGPDGNRRPEVKAAFKRAWLHHIHLNPHHWNAWTNLDTDGVSVLPMPEKYWREMLADWYGAGRAITGEWRAGEWFDENEGKIVLHPDTKTMVVAGLLHAKLQFGWK